jgi:hypothetical protein
LTPVLSVMTMAYGPSPANVEGTVQVKEPLPSSEVAPAGVCVLEADAVLAGDVVDA